MNGPSNRPLSILFLNPSAQLGGAERSLLDVLGSLREREPEWKLHLVLTGDGPLRKRAEALGVNVQVLPLPSVLAHLGDGGSGLRKAPPNLGTLLRAGPAAARYALQLRRTISALSPDVVHSNGFKMHILGAWSTPSGISLVWHVHDFVSRRPVMSGFMRRHAWRCSAMVVNSKSVALDVARVCGDGVNIHLVYNAVNLSEFSPEGAVADLDAMSGMPTAPPGTVRVGLVATLGWWKGHETFLDSLRRLPPELPIRGYVVGGALYETKDSQHTLEDLRAKAAELGVAERVGFTGFLDYVPDAMRALDVVVHASTEPEAFGLVIVEGMACGKAVIASEAGGAAELIADGRNALGHKPGDSEDLARCIERLAVDGDLRQRMGEEGRRMVEAEFDRARLATDLIPVYRATLAKRARKLQ